MAIYYGNELYHYGVPGQKWGKRNYQYEDGSYTQEGQSQNGGHSRYASNYSDQKPLSLRNDKTKSNKTKSNKTKSNYRKAIKAGLIIGGALLATYGVYKIYSDRDLLIKEIKLGKKSVDFIRNSGKFDYLIAQEDNESPMMQSLLNRLERSDSDLRDLNSISQIKKLTDDELRALQAYTAPQFYKQVNGVAQGIFENADEGYFAEFDESSKIIAKDIISAMSKVTLEKDVELQRGINYGGIYKIFGKKGMNEIEIVKEILANNSGSKINTEKMFFDNFKGIDVPSVGFTSTAVPFKNPMLNNSGKVEFKNHSIADYFSGKDGIIFDLTGKKGSHAINISSISELKTERELLFAPGQDIILDGNAQIIDGILHLFGTIGDD